MQYVFIYSIEFFFMYFLCDFVINMDDISRKKCSSQLILLYIEILLCLDTLFLVPGFRVVLLSGFRNFVLKIDILNEV